MYYTTENSLLTKLCVQCNATIRLGLNCINEGGVQFALVTDAQGRLVGTMTDGDIRRSLLKGGTLENQISTMMNAKFEYVRENDMEDEDPLAIMRGKKIRHLPVVDADGRPKALYTTFPAVASTLDVPVIIMAGGLGTRLRPMTENCPKPLLELGGKPILERILIYLVTQGLREFYFSVNYRSDMIENYFGDGHRWNASITYLHEPTRLGTAGALGEIKKQINTPFIVQNGDLITDFAYEDLVNAHLKSGAVATMGLRSIRTQIEFGVVQLEGNLITEVVEKPNLEHHINAGIYCMSPEVLKYVKRGKYMDMPDLFTELMKDGHPCHGYEVPGSWIDIGTPNELKRAQSLFSNE